jgi:hypothetical protein
VAEDFDQFNKGLGGALSKAVKAKTPRFIKPKKNGKPRKGWYSLKQHKPPKLAVSGVEKGLSNLNIGAGGEHAVISELLFNGFNAADRKRTYAPSCSTSIFRLFIFSKLARFN